MKNIFSLKKSAVALSLLMTCGASAQVTFDKIMSSKGDNPTLPFTHRTVPAVGDFNNDDFMDIIMGGQAFGIDYVEGAKFDIGGWYSAAIVIKNNGDGTFTISTKCKHEVGTEDNPDTPGAPVEDLINLPVSTKSFFRFLDFNNDGNLDLIIRGKGEHNFLTNESEYLMLLENQGPENGYKFKLVENHGLNQAHNEDYLTGISIGDYDKDGFVDVLLMGCENKDQSNDPENPNYDPERLKRRFVELYKNNGGDGTFTIQKIAETFGEEGLDGNFKPMSHGDVAFVDIDNDGWLDIFCTGYADNEDGSVRESGKEIRIYQNIEEGTAFLDVTPFDNDTFQGGYDITLFVEDLNGDGLMDLILLGDGAPTPGGGTIYMNEGDFVFTPVDMETSGFVQVRAVPTGTFADMNHDGKLDAALMGYSNSLGYFSGIIYQGDNNTYNYGGEKEVFNAGERQGGLVIADFSNDGKLDAFGVDGNVSNEVALFKNTSEMVNQAPTAPTNVVAKIEKGMLTVTWDDATDDVTPAEALFYNVYVKNNNTGKISMIIPANPETGRLKVITDYQTGVRSVLKSYSVKVDASEGYSYTVGVQAIDQAQGASTFTTQLLGKDTGIAQSEVANNVRIETVKEGFIVRADSNLDVEVTDMLGRVVAKDKANNVIPVSSNGIYLITTGGRTYKVGK